MPKIVPFERSRAKPAPRKRKSADEWRAIARASKVRDGRPLILAFPDPRKLGQHVLAESYWHVKSGQWFLANTAPELPGCEAANDVYGEPEFWRPMPAQPSLSAGINLDAKTDAKKTGVKKASKKQPAKAALGPKSVAQPRLNRNVSRPLVDA